MQVCPGPQREFALSGGPALRYVLLFMEQENRLVREADGDTAQLRARVRELEAKLQQEKMDAVGRLAGGVSHDLNNLLTPILAYSNMLVEELPPGAAGREFAQEIVSAGDRLVVMTKTLQSLRVKPAPLVGVAVAAAVHTALDVLLPELGPDLELDLQLPADIQVQCESGQLERIVEALVRNARQAMPAGGRLTIRAEAVADPAAERLPAGEWIRLMVRDEGAGIPPDVREHMFEPYFSTRPKGQGKGLGLSVTYASVRRAGGQLRALSEIGAGAELHIFLRRPNGNAGPLSEA